MSALRALFRTLFGSGSPTGAGPSHRRGPQDGQGAAAPTYYDTFNSTAANLGVSVNIVGSKFTVTVICELCQKKQPARGFIFNGADNNLATAVGFALAEYGKHTVKNHQ